MPNIDLAKLYKTQISLSEWFEKIGHKDVEALRLEDNEKRERLNVLWQRLGLPFDRPNKFSAVDILDGILINKLGLKKTDRA